MPQLQHMPQFQPMAQLPFMLMSHQHMTMVVTYNVLDAQSGYVADVKYEGQPIPYAAPAPAYGPAPIVPAYGRGPVLVAN